MKDKLKSLKGHLKIRVDNKIVYDGHNEIKPTALIIIIKGLINEAMPDLDQVKLYKGTATLVQTLTRVRGTEVSNSAVLNFSNAATSHFTLEKLELCDRVNSSVFSEVVIHPQIIVLGQTIDIEWTIDLTL